MAADHQYRDNDCYIPDGVPDSKYSEPRQRGLHLKLDELIRVTESARNKLLDLEDLTEEDLKRLKGSFTRLAATPENAHLQKAADELEVASEGIQEAKQNVAAAIGKA